MIDAWLCNSHSLLSSPDKFAKLISIFKFLRHMQPQIKLFPYTLDVCGIETSGDKNFCTRLARHWGPPNVLYSWNRISFTKLVRPGCALITHSYLARRSKKEYSYKFSNLLHFWASWCLIRRDIVIALFGVLLHFESNFLFYLKKFLFLIALSLVRS